jgi:hypothetical protein
MSDAYRHLEVLERRIDWLGQRIAFRNRVGKETTHDVDEIQALKWAVQTIYDWVELPKVDSNNEMSLNKDER